MRFFESLDSISWIWMPSDDAQIYIYAIQGRDTIVSSRMITWKMVSS